MIGLLHLHYCMLVVVGGTVVLPSCYRKFLQAHWWMFVSLKRPQKFQKVPLGSTEQRNGEGHANPNNGSLGDLIHPQHQDKWQIKGIKVKLSTTYPWKCWQMRWENCGQFDAGSYLTFYLTKSKMFRPITSFTFSLILFGGKKLQYIYELLRSSITSSNLIWVLFSIKVLQPSSIRSAPCQLYSISLFPVFSPFSGSAMCTACPRWLLCSVSAWRTGLTVYFFKVHELPCALVVSIQSSYFLYF